jgi:hypothetical protein
MHFSPQNGMKTRDVKCPYGTRMPKLIDIEKLLIPSESAPQELYSEWSCQYVSTVLNILADFCVPPLVTEVTISP